MATTEVQDSNTPRMGVPSERSKKTMDAAHASYWRMKYVAEQRARRSRARSKASSRVKKLEMLGLLVTIVLLLHIALFQALESLAPIGELNPAAQSQQPNAATPAQLATVVHTTVLTDDH